MPISRVLTAVVLSMLGARSVGLAAAPLEIVVSVEPHRWLVEQVGGERVSVQVLVAPGESPESYQPTDAQVTALMRASIYFQTGVAFEHGPWFDAVSKMGSFEMVDLRQGLDLRPNDPHVWLSPVALVVQGRTIARALAARDSAQSPLFESNLAALEASLESLDRELQRLLTPFAGRAFFVFHPSWGYFADRYQLEQVALEIEGQVPSDRELTGLQRRAREERVTTVFVQPQFHGQAARAFAASIGARVETLDPLASEVAENLMLSARKIATALRKGVESER